MSDTVIALSMAEEIAKQASQKTEEILIGQLNELIKRDLIVIARGPQQLAQTSDGHVELCYSIKLLPKNLEYIEQLEQENIQLKAKVRIYEDTIRKAFSED